MRRKEFLKLEGELAEALAAHEDIYILCQRCTQGRGMGFDEQEHTKECERSMEAIEAASKAFNEASYISYDSDGLLGSIPAMINACAIDAREVVRILPDGSMSFEHPPGNGYIAATDEHFVPVEQFLSALLRMLDGTQVWSDGWAYHDVTLRDKIRVALEKPEVLEALPAEVGLPM